MGWCEFTAEFLAGKLEYFAGCERDVSAAEDGLRNRKVGKILMAQMCFLPLLDIYTLKKNAVMYD